MDINELVRYSLKILTYRAMRFLLMILEFSLFAYTMVHPDWFRMTGAFLFGALASIVVMINQE